MGFFTSLLTPERIKPKHAQRSLEDIPELKGWLFGEKTASGVDVTPDTALSMLAVFACIRVLAEALAQLPWILYRRLPGGGKERAVDNGLYTLLHNMPNSEMTSFSFRETLMGHLCGWGNAYAEIEFNGAGEPVGLWPLRPDLMKPERNGRNLVYLYDQKPLPAYRVFHVPGLGFDGRVGYSPIAIARQAIGLGMAAEEFSARFFANDGRPGIVIEHPGHLGDEAFKNLQTSWKDEHGGVANAHHPAILEEGMKIHEIGLPGEDVQFLATRKFQRAEIAGMYRVPPHMIGDMERATNANVEEMSQEFITYSLGPWMAQWEQTVAWKLISPERRGELFAEFLAEAMLRGNTETRYGAYAVGRQNGWLSANDVREKENMNPIEGGDVYLIPLNMVPASTTAASTTASDAPAPSTAAGTQSVAGDASGVKRSAEMGESRMNSALPTEQALEERSYKSARNRNRLTHAYQRMFVDTFGRIVRREQADVRRAAERYLSMRGQAGQERRDVYGFTQWLDTFYRDHQAFVAKAVTPMYTSFREAVELAARDEVDAMATDMAGALGTFETQYVEDFARRFAETGKSRINSALQTAQESGGDPGQAVEGELTRWDGGDGTSSRAQVQTQWESVRFGNAIAATVFALAGREFIRWHAFGDNCPYCRKLDGRKVGIQETFIEPGTGFEAEGAEKPLTVNNKVHHPPAHGGCDCTIGAA